MRLFWRERYARAKYDKVSYPPKIITFSIPFIIVGLIVCVLMLCYINLDFIILAFLGSLLIAFIVLSEDKASWFKHNHINRFSPDLIEEIDNDAQLAPKVHLITLSPVPDSQENAYTHAIQATQRAGINPNWASVLPIDIGLVGFSDNQTGIIYRIAPIPAQIKYIQPFVKLHVRHATHKRIRFEIKDDQDSPVLKSEKEYALKIGENLVTPATRLPVAKLETIKGLWKLWIYENDEPLAVHHFGWERDSVGGVTVPISQDGEISPELTDELESQFGTISLDELLGDDSDQSAQKRL